MPCYSRYRFNFIHIPKTGGTSIKWALYRDKDGHETGFKEVVEGTDGHQSLDEMYELCPEAKDWPSFTVIRDPLDRIFSAFRWSEENLASRCQFRRQNVVFKHWVGSDNFLYHYERNHIFQPASRFLTTLPDIAIRFEELEDGYKRLMKHPNWRNRIPPLFNDDLPFQNKTKNIHHHYEIKTQALDLYTQSKIKEFYAEEYKLLEEIPYI